MRHVTATVTVPAYGCFPFDMLRYDSCWPVHEGDACRLAEVSDKPREISVARWSDRPKRGEHWTVRRWESFGVHIEPEKP